MRAYAAVLVLLVAGCVAPDPRFDTDPVFRQASLECDYEAQKASAGGRTMADRVGDRVYIYKACMRLRGY